MSGDSLKRRYAKTLASNRMLTTVKRLDPKAHPWYEQQIRTVQAILRGEPYKSVVAGRKVSPNHALQTVIGMIRWQRAPRWIGARRAAREKSTREWMERNNLAYVLPYKDMDSDLLRMLTCGHSIAESEIRGRKRVKCAKCATGEPGRNMRNLYPSLGGWAKWVEAGSEVSYER